MCHHIFMTSEAIPTDPNVCLISLLGEARKGDPRAQDYLAASWYIGGEKITESGIRRVVPCILAQCNVEVVLNGYKLESDEMNREMCSGTCKRDGRSLDLALFEIKSRDWPSYKAGDVKPSDPDYMDI